MVSFIMPPCPFLKEDLVGKRYGCLPLPLVLVVVVNQTLFTTVTKLSVIDGASALCGKKDS